MSVKIAQQTQCLSGGTVCYNDMLSYSPVLICRSFGGKKEHSNGFLKDFITFSNLPPSESHSSDKLTQVIFPVVLHESLDYCTERYVLLFPNYLA